MMAADWKALIVLTAVLVALGGQAGAAPGGLDPTFGVGGIVSTEVDFLRDALIMSIDVQPDGKIVAAGESYVLRYRADGSLDSSFDSDGMLRSSVVNASSTAIQTDGKIIVGGIRFSGGGFGVVRYNPDGSQDLTFGSSGVATAPIGSGGASVGVVALQSDGKVVVAATFWNGSDYDFAVARYDPGGTPDSTFGSNGLVSTDFDGQDDDVTSLAIQSNGKIVVAGRTRQGDGFAFALVRYNSDGSLDSTFDLDGKVSTQVDDTSWGTSVVIQADGKIVLGGQSAIVDRGSRISTTLVRYSRNGVLDSTFGVGGVVKSDGDRALSLAIGQEGRIVAVVPRFGLRCCRGSPPSSYLYVVFGLNAYGMDGSPDTTFGSNGQVTTAIGPRWDYPTSVAIQSDGQIVAAGKTQPDIDVLDTNFALVRYEGGSLCSHGNEGAMCDDGDESTFDDLCVAGICLGEPPVGPLDYYPVTPCRSVDTRFDPGPSAGVPEKLLANVDRDFEIGGSCGIPTSARAVSGLLSIVDPTAAGYVTLYPADESRPVVSAVNFPPGGVTNNNTLAKLSSDGTGTLRAYSPTGTLDFIFDVNGYFAAP